MQPKVEEYVRTGGGRIKKRCLKEEEDTVRKVGNAFLLHLEPEAFTLLPTLTWSCPASLFLKITLVTSYTETPKVELGVPTFKKCTM